MVGEGVLERDGLLGAVAMPEHGPERPAGDELGKTEDVHAVVLADLRPVGGLLEGEREDALFLEIRFVDACEGAHDDRPAAEPPR